MSDAENKLFQLTAEEQQTINQLLAKGRREVPPFYAQGVNKKIYVPVADGEIRVFHHKPVKPESKRPVLFVPGWLAAPETFEEFTAPLHGKIEYFYLETREKRSSRLRRHKGIKLNVEQTAIDLGEAIKHLGLQQQDFVLVGTSYGAASILQGVLAKNFDAPTIVLFDPIVKWTKGKKVIQYIVKPMPAVILGAFKFLFILGIGLYMRNKAQRERMRYFVRGAQPWKAKKNSIQIKDFTIEQQLPKIQKEVLIFSGPKDKFHPRIDYYNYTKALPNGRFVFMDTADEDRELLAGVVAKEFAMISKEEKIPEEFMPFEIAIKRG